MKSAQKRQQIISVAKSCFAQFGYDRTTLDDIGRRMGLNKSSLYYYFRNKEEIYTEVVLQEAENIIRDLQVEMLDKVTPEERIRHYMKSRLGYYRRVLSLHRLSAESLRQIQPGFHELYDNILKREIQFISRQLRLIDDRVSDSMVNRTAELLISAADAIKHDEIIYNKKDTYDEPDYKKIEADINLLIHLVLHGFSQTVDMSLQGFVEKNS